MSYQQARLNAEYQLAVLTATRLSTEGEVFLLGDCTAILWWDDETPLYEFPFLDHSGSETGHVIAAGDRRLLPIFEYATSPGRPSHLVLSEMTGAITRQGKVPLGSKIYYFGPLDWIVRFDFGDHVEFMKYPEGWTGRTENPDPVKRNPTAWTPDEAAHAWDQLAQRAKNNPVSERRVLSRVPVRYNQGCSAYGFDGTRVEVSGGTSVCSPACLAGCAPVAGAMLASAWKRFSHQGSEKIFFNDPNWMLEWPSRSRPNPSQSDEVSGAIWDFHNRMKTSCAGSTYDDQIENGLQTVFRGRWGVNFYFDREGGVEFDADVVDLIKKYRQPFVFCAEADWAHLPLNSVGNVGGHAVVCFGYDTAEQCIHFALGWGSGHANRWTPLRLFRSTSCFYLVKGGLTEKGEGYDRSRLIVPEDADETTC